MHELCINHTAISLTLDRVSLMINTTHNYIVLLENNTLAELVGVTVTAKETRQQKAWGTDKTKKGSISAI